MVANSSSFVNSAMFFVNCATNCGDARKLLALIRRARLDLVARRFSSAATRAKVDTFPVTTLMSC